MKDKTIIIAGWSIADPDKRDKAVAIFEDLVQRARSAPGCLDLAISADPVDPSRINTFELWRSEKDWRAWRAVAGALRGLPRMRGGEVRKHVVESSGPPL
jgi:quinol monooxygenase YgiN